ncbi:MAG: hypothetical protein ABSG26_18685 [Bryobacteraceae bacterium]
MTPVPLDLPLRPSEAAELAILIFEQAERKPLNDEVRNRLTARAAVLRLETVTPYFGSLVRDPVHPSTYYLAIDAGRGEPMLLHLAPATAPTSSIFYKPLLIGRMRRPSGPEIVINAVPFGPSDCENLEKFVSQIGAAFLPRPQGLRPAIAVSGGLAAAFDAFRAILKRSGKNLAATAANPAASGRDFYYAGLCAAIRAGWREGYSAGIHVVVAGDNLDAARETIRNAAGFTRFSIDTSCLFRETGNGAALEDRAWILDEFVRPFEIGDAVYEFTPPEVLRLASKFGPALKINEQLHESIRQARSALKTGRSFDFEPSLEGAASATTPQELIFWLHWLKARGHGAQLAAPNLGGDGVAERLKEFAAIARHYQCTLSIRSGAGHSAEALETIARATVGRVNYTISPELRLPPENSEYGRYIVWLAEHLVV